MRYKIVIELGDILQKKCNEVAEDIMELIYCNYGEDWELIGYTLDDELQ